MRPRPCSRISVRRHRGRAYRSDGLPARPLFCSMLAACVALGATACGRHIYLAARDGAGGTGSGILWQATFETGDLSEWLGDGNGGIYMDNLASAPAPTPGPGAPRLLQRHRHLRADDGHVFQLPVSRATEPSRGVLRRLVLHSRVPAGQILAEPAPFRLPPKRRRRGDHPALGLQRLPGPDGNLIAHLYDSTAVANTDQTNPIPVPVAKWVHFEILYRKAADATGRITIWQDGVQILDLANVVTAPTDWVQWDVGGGSNDIAPSPATVYFDDATISLTRVGVGQYRPGRVALRRAD